MIHLHWLSTTMSNSTLQPESLTATVKSAAVSCQLLINNNTNQHELYTATSINNIIRVRLMNAEQSREAADG